MLQDPLLPGWSPFLLFIVSLFCRLFVTHTLRLTVPLAVPKLGFVARSHICCGSNRLLVSVAGPAVKNPRP